MLAVVLLNAAFAFAQEMRAERAVDALTGAVPACRLGRRRAVPLVAAEERDPRRAGRDLWP
ncbi:hypothetical protein [Jidongwangia harbinensis]|uniref:hypothetical protein n=1 Tax=Jidongwangia harbinensis TaxID=2878561 RepID=UPI001CD9CE9D|nr:hypothetical protein [Jidongwangia harbinensis]MCA2219306.1 hypothetical protein [Jidongwangia harbinensis]